ncbi:hypothetical protein C8Q78DRAFT_965126, partial [Trametes maxima]
DSIDWSCAYDSMLTVLCNLHTDNPQLLSFFNDSSLESLLLAVRLPHSAPNADQLVRLRDDIRDGLWARQPQTFPRRGPVMTAVSDVARVLLGLRTPWGRATARCEDCHSDTACTTDAVKSYFWSVAPSVWKPYYNDRATISATEYVSCCVAGGFSLRCVLCGSRSRVYIELDETPPLLCLEVFNDCVTPDMTLSLQLTSGPARLRLAGIIYLGFGHFTCRYLASDGATWYHDGAHTGNVCVPEVGFTPSTHALSQCRSRTASHYIYVRD